MDLWYDGQRKGRGTRVLIVEKDGAAWFIVRHGGTFKRENAVDDGQPTVVFYRPEAYDLLIYYPNEGELAIYNDGNSIKERRAYCAYVGKNIFSNPDFFDRRDANKHSLEALRKKGRAAMNCTDIPGLRSARMDFLRYRFPGENGHCVTHTAGDVFGGLEDMGQTIPEEAELVSMGVKLTPEGGVAKENALIEAGKIVEMKVNEKIATSIAENSEIDKEAV